MSTRERVHNVVDRLSEEQLHAFLVIFDNEGSSGRDERTEKPKAYDEMMQILQRMPPIGDIDEKAELAAYRDERYGEGL